MFGEFKWTFNRIRDSQNFIAKFRWYNKFRIKEKLFEWSRINYPFYGGYNGKYGNNNESH